VSSTFIAWKMDVSMPPGPKQSLGRELLGHVIMGAGLGAFLAISLLVIDARRIFQMIINSAASMLMLFVFVGTFALIFAVGAALTGVVFILEDRS